MLAYLCSVLTAMLYKRIKVDLLMCYKVLHNYTCLNCDEIHTLHYRFYKR